MFICKFLFIITLLSSVRALPKSCYEESLNEEETLFRKGAASLRFRTIQRGSGIYLRCPSRITDTNHDLIWRHGKSMLKLRKINKDFACSQIVVGANFLSLNIDDKDETEGFFGCVVFNVVTKAVETDFLVFISFYEPRMLSTKYVLIVRTQSCSNATTSILQSRALSKMKTHCVGCKLDVSVECKGDHFPFEKRKLKNVKGGTKLILQEGGQAANLENLDVGSFIHIANCKEWTAASEISLISSIPSYSYGAVRMQKKVIFKILFNNRNITVQRLDIGGGSSSQGIEVPEAVSEQAFLDIGLEFCLDSIRLELCFKPTTTEACETTHVSAIPLPGASTVLSAVQKIFFEGNMERRDLRVMLFDKPRKRWAQGPQQWGAMSDNFLGTTFRYSQFENEKFKVMSVTKKKQGSDSSKRVQNFVITPFIALENGKQLLVDVALDTGFLGTSSTKQRVRISYDKNGYDPHFTQVSIKRETSKFVAQLTDTSNATKTVAVNMTDVSAMDNVLNVVFVISTAAQLVFIQNKEVYKNNRTVGMTELKNVIVKVEVGHATFTKDNFISVSSSTIEGDQKSKSAKLSLLQGTDVHFREALDVSDFTPVLGGTYMKVLLSLDDQDISDLVENIPPSCLYIDCTQAIIIEHLQGKVFKTFFSEVSKFVRSFATAPIVKQIEKVRYSCPKDYFLLPTSLMLCQKCEAGTEVLLTDSSAACKPCGRQTYQSAIGERCIPCGKTTEGEVLWTSCFSSNDSLAEKGKEEEKDDRKDEEVDGEVIAEKFAWRPMKAAVVFDLMPLLVIFSLTGGLFLIFMTKIIVRYLHFS